MWNALLAVLLAVAGVWALCALSARLARQSERLKQAGSEEKEREEVDKILERVDAMSDDELLALLRSGADKK